MKFHPGTAALSRRDALRGMAALGATALLGRLGAADLRPNPLLTRKIPSSGEEIPVVGLGSWITFNVGEDAEARDECAEVMRRFFGMGGRLIDSSPMYGSSQAVIGHGLAKLGRTKDVFSAEKVWTSARNGRAQIEETRRRWGVATFDLLQVHNLEDWEANLAGLFEMKAAKKLRYVGVTTSHGRRTAETERIMRTQPLDFVQVTYNAVDRELEQRLLPLAQERGIAVIVNRPFREGALIDEVKRHPLPAWAAECDCANWAQFLLKFVVSHPAVACAIPATSSADHVVENMGAAYGRLPDAALRKRMADHVRAL
jgi:diketogulonate reductase-like aldo/keto reductase